MAKLDYMNQAGAYQLTHDIIKMNSSKYKYAAFNKGYPAFGEDLRSNLLQRMGYENIKSTESYNKNYEKVMSDN